MSMRDFDLRFAPVRKKVLETGRFIPPPVLPPGARPRPRKRVSTFREIYSMVKEVAMGRSDLPLPGIGMVGRGMQLQAIGRQQLARVPFAAKAAAAGGAGLGAGAAIEVITGKSPAGLLHKAIGQLGPRPQSMGRRQPVSRQLVRQHPSQHMVVRTWQTFPGGPIFQRFSDGHIEVQKKDGTIKTFRPYRPVVIPRKWNARAMSRVATALKRQRKTATKILQITGGVPKRTVRVRDGQSHRSVDV